MNTPTESQIAGSFIDADVSIEFESHEELYGHMPAYWREYFEQSDFEGPRSNGYLGHSRTGSMRLKSSFYKNGLMGYVAAVQEHYFSRYRPIGVIFNPIYNIESIRHPDLSTVLAAAINDWMWENISVHVPEALFSIIVSPHYPDEAASEILRVARRGGAAQVILPVCTAIPLGNRINRAIFQAAAECRLPVALQFGGYPGNPPTSSGWYTYFVEEYAGMKLIFESQLMSLIAEGVFEEYPELKIILLNSGVTWLPSFAWRFDKEWRGMRRDVPWVKKPPSEYIRHHVYCTTSGLDAPGSAQVFADLCEEIDLSSMLLFSSRYPYSTFDRLEELLPPALRTSHPPASFTKNARVLYPFPTNRATLSLKLPS